MENQPENAWNRKSKLEIKRDYGKRSLKELKLGYHNEEADYLLYRSVMC